MGTYAYDQAWQEERERLAGIERLWDDGTTALLERLGVGAGSRVAEVAAGGGSSVEWLADRVGDSGRVLATDVYVKFIEPLAGGPVEVREHDILSSPLPEKEFDLVHTRLLVEHVGTGALSNMVAGLRPGGVLLVEEYDMACRGGYPDDPFGDRMTDAVLDLMGAVGFDAECGRKLPAELESLGLEDVQSEGRVRVIRGGTDDTAFFRLSLEALRGRIVEAGRAQDDEIGAWLETLHDPQRFWLSPALIACWGRQPSA